MVNEQPEALRLAEWAEWFCRNVNDQKDFRWVHMSKQAAELRRLHAENEDFRATCDHLIRENAEHIGEIVVLKAQRDELLAALRWTLTMDATDDNHEGWDRVHEAIAKATGETK